MKKINIVKSNEDFNNIIKLGRLIKNKYYIIYYQENTKDKYRVGIAVPKKTGNAVCRNKIKRQIKTIIDNNEKKLNKKDYIIIIRNNILDIDYSNKEQELLNLINKI